MATGPRVLVVEDDPTQLRWMAGVLEAQGYAVVAAADGDDAETKAVVERPDCIVLDVVLPKLNGFQVCRHLKHLPETSAIPVILVSVKDTPADRQWGLQQGAALYLAKPFQAEALVRGIRSVL
jgi:twitching motility two-component system response regulator PilH